MDTLDSYNAQSDPVPMQPDRMAKRTKTDPVFVVFGIFFMLCLAASQFGCYGSPIDTRAIDADKVTITHSTPWSSLTIQAEGWHSTVKTLDGKDMGAGNSQALRITTGQGEAAAVQPILESK